MSFTIKIKPEASDDIKYYRVNEQRVIIDGIKNYLLDRPDIMSQRKKLLRPNNIAPWELRIDIYRVFYYTDTTTVYIVAVGHKIHNRLYIRGKEVSL